ncbi:hypothetical protein ACFV2U_53095 [Streptomyces sp. NPDC059697]|uniref:hypothetical protein n=1 Tax=Streptomyces sp. NPDC059697 TaxID=3346912 RepID=UPI0036A820E1
MQQPPAFIVIDLTNPHTFCHPDRPWHGRRFSAGWGTHGELEYHPVRPDLVAEFRADTAVDDARYRHPVRFLRLRDDLAVHQVPPFGT